MIIASYIEPINITVKDVLPYLRVDGTITLNKIIDDRDPYYPKMKEIFTGTLKELKRRKDLLSLKPNLSYSHTEDYMSCRLGVRDPS